MYPPKPPSFTLEALEPHHKYSSLFFFHILSHFSYLPAGLRTFFLWVTHLCALPYVKRVLEPPQHESLPRHDDVTHSALGVTIRPTGNPPPAVLTGLPLSLCQRLLPWEG